MAFDLGLDFENNSDAYINEAFKIMERRFGLVLLTDYFEESLILLKGEFSLNNVKVNTKKPKWKQKQGKLNEKKESKDKKKLNKLKGKKWKWKQEKSESGNRKK